ncbi:hypothetical protein L2E82_06594 [Cichorium intybus]|uniref:Uncharacterized protein n=1 Tax=Cichorium intybus TaxID=13427 RepID=A0ACB9HBJ6_CICIN|nr:hypothetical protein L2E82_06594 [Cichorium intybus]
MGMRYTSGINVNTFIGTLVVLMLLVHPGRAGMYTCWGGCLNQCVLLADKKPEEKSPCYWNCLAKCFPQSGQIAASLTGPRNIIEPSKPNNLPAIINNKPKYLYFGLGRKYYCIIGCSLQSCMIPGHAGIDLKICLVRCTHKCK